MMVQTQTLPVGHLLTYGRYLTDVISLSWISVSSSHLGVLNYIVAVILVPTAV